MIVTVIHFSGTGTTARLAGELKAIWDERPDFKVRTATAEEVLGDPAVLQDSQALVFGYPVYDYKPPEIVRRAIDRLPVRQNPLPVAQFVTYGISPGLCLRRCAEGFRHKGYHPVAEAGFKAPAAVAALYARAGRFPFNRLYRFAPGTPDRLAEFADMAAHRFVGFRPDVPADPSPPANRFMAAVRAAAPGPVISRVTFGRAFYRDLEVSGACTGCGHCVRHCPESNLRMRDGQAVADKRNGCLRCLRCVVDCPEQAVNFTVRRRIGSIPGDGWKGLYEKSR